MSPHHLTLGIDPGKHGALAVMSPAIGLVDVIDMPDARGAALGALVAEIVADFAPDTFEAAWVEKVGSRPGQGHMNVWTFAEGYGAVLGALGALRVPVHHVTPQAWKKAQGVTKDKGSSRQRACELWPAEAGRFARVRDDGRAEAALIALYGWKADR